MKKFLFVVMFLILVYAVLIFGCKKNSPASSQDSTHTATVTATPSIINTSTATASITPTSTYTPVVKILALIQYLGNETNPQYSVDVYHNNVVEPNATVIVSNLTTPNTVVLTFNSGSYYAIAADGAEYTPNNQYRVSVTTNGKTYTTEGLSVGGLSISDYDGSTGVNVGCQYSGDADEIQIQGNSPAYPELFFTTEVGNPQFTYPKNIAASVFVSGDNSVFARVYYTVQNSFNYAIDPVSYLQFYVVRLKVVSKP